MEVDIGGSKQSPPRGCAVCAPRGPNFWASPGSPQAFVSLCEGCSPSPPLFMHGAIQVAWFHCPWDVLPSVESVMGHWISEPTGTTDRKLGGSQALDSTGICLCQRSETGQAFRDVDLGGRVVSRATRHPTPLPVLGNLQNYPCFLEARVPRVVNWGVWGLPRPGPVQFYLDPRIL